MNMPSPLSNLHPYEYEHPFDAKALNMLEGTVGLDTLIKLFNKHAVERWITIQYTGSNLKLTKETYPEIYSSLEKACAILNLPNLPDFYVEQDHHINGFTVGVERPIIVLTSGAIDALTEDELLYLIGHEVGHIKSRHTLYHQMGRYLPIIADIAGQATLGIGKLISSPAQLALIHWGHVSEFTADRAGLLACQNVDTAIRVMVKWAGMPHKHYKSISTESFIKQARDFETLDYDQLNMVMKFYLQMNSTHPWTVMRAAELLRWIDGGAYSSVLNRESTKHIKKLYQGDSIICRNCDRRLNGNEKFCPGCGVNLVAI